MQRRVGLAGSVQGYLMQRRICLAEVFAETSHAEEDWFSGECSRISHAEEDWFSGEFSRISHAAKDLFSAGACRNKSCRGGMV